MGARLLHPVLRRLRRIGDAYVAAVHRFAEKEGISVVHFAKGGSKEAFARPLS